MALPQLQFAQHQIWALYYSDCIVFIVQKTHTLASTSSMETVFLAASCRCADPCFRLRRRSTNTVIRSITVPPPAAAPAGTINDVECAVAVCNAPATAAEGVAVVPDETSGVESRLSPAPAERSIDIDTKAVGDALLAYEMEVDDSFELTKDDCEDSGDKYGVSLDDVGE